MDSNVDDTLVPSSIRVPCVPCSCVDSNVDDTLVPSSIRVHVSRDHVWIATLMIRCCNGRLCVHLQVLTWIECYFVVLLRVITCYYVVRLRIIFNYVTEKPIGK